MSNPPKKKLQSGHDYFERIGDETEIQADEDQNTWAVSFSDIATILLVFFILLLSFSVINPNKFEVVQKSISGANVETTNIAKLEVELENLINNLGIQQFVDLTKEDFGLNIEIRNEIMFASGSASLGGTSSQIISRLVRELSKLPKQYNFLIEGHTDDVPINDQRYPSNWHLSAARALSVLNIFSQQGVDDNRLRVEGFADTAPLKDYPFRDKNGNPIPENRERNRRVVIQVR